MKQTKAPDYAATLAPIGDGKIVLLCHSVEDARPWVKLLQAAGVTLTKLPADGARYRIDVDELLSAVEKL